MSQDKLRILFRGWLNVPHSYSIVNCFQLIHLYKNHSDKVDIYVQEMPYFRAEWNKAKKLVYSEEYNEIINGFKQWDGESVDVVYSITYPYNITEVKISDKTVPKCVFYTSEFAWLDSGYFSIDNESNLTEETIRSYIDDKDIWFTCPSIWSKNGLKQMGIRDHKNKVITHGVDASIFYLQKTGSKREEVRKFYGVKDTDILMINIGAMTGNKGIILILEALHQLVNVKSKKNFKVLFKGTGDLYTSKQFLQSYIDGLLNNNVFTKQDADHLMQNHIIFTDKTLSYKRINDLFNAADLYISPYLAEGFNLTVLESLACGLPVLVPQTGSTEQYIEDIYGHGGDQYIVKVKSNVGRHPNGMLQNVIETRDLVSSLLANENFLQTMKINRLDNYDTIRSYVVEHYSWDKVSDMLYNYLLQVKSSAK